MSQRFKTIVLPALLRILRVLWGCLRFAVGLGSVLVATLFFLLYDPPPVLKRLLIETAESQSWEWTALPLQLGAISDLKLRPQTQRIVFENIRLYGYRGATQPFLVLPRLSLELDLVNYLLGFPSHNQVILTQPRISILRDRQGKLNIRPRFKPGEDKPEEPPGPRPALPFVQIRIEDSQLNFRDQDSHYPLQSLLKLPWIEGQLVDQEHFDFSARLRSSLSNLDAQGRLNIWTGQTRLDAEWASADLPNLARYAARVPDLVVLGGALNLKAHAQWEDYQLRKLAYRGRFSADHLRARVPMYRLPLELSTETLFTQDKIEVHWLDLVSPGHRLSLHGELLHYLQPKQTHLDAQLQIAKLDLTEVASAVMHPAIDAFKAMQPSGNLSSKLHLTGLLSDLRVAGEVNIPQARVQKINIRQGFTRFSYGAEQVDVPELRAGVFAGQIHGSARLSLGQHPLIDSAQMQGEQVSLAEIQSTFALALPEDYAPAGRVNFQVQASGPLNNPRAHGRLSSARMDFPASHKLAEITGMRLNFDYSQPLTRATLQALSADAGAVKMGLYLRALDDLDVWLDAENLPLKTANKWTPVAYFQGGEADFSARLKGSLRAMQKNWQAFSAQGTVQGRELALFYPLNPGAPIQQDLRQLDFELDWQQGQVELSQLVLNQGQTALRGSGRVSLPGLERQDWSGALQAHLEGGVYSQDLPLLKNYQIDKGQVNLLMDLQGAPRRDVQVALKADGKALMVAGVELDQFNFDGDYAAKKIDIRQAQIKKNEEHVDLQGQVDLNTASPSLALQAQAYRFDLKTLFSLLPPETRAPFEKRRTKLDVPPADPTPVLYNLPEARKHVFSSGHGQSITLDEFLTEYWGRWTIPPTTRDEMEATEKKPALADSLAGKLSVDLKVKGTVAEPEVDLKGLLQNVQIQDSQIAESYIQAQYADRHIHVDQAYIQEPGGGVLRASGDLDLDKDMQFELQGEGLSLKLADPFLKGQKTRLEGNLDFLAVATGTLQKPEVSAQLTVDRLLMNQLYFDRLDTISGYNEGYLKDLRVELKSGNQEIVVYGDFPATDLNKPVDLTLSLKDESFGLINLFTNALDWRDGKGSVQVRLVGTPRKPELEGTLSMDKATVYIPSLKEVMSEIDIRGEVFTNKVNLAYLRGKVAGGNLEVKGNMDLLNLLPSFLNLDVSAQDLLIRYTMPGLLTTQTTVKDATIKIKGLIDQPFISGKVVLGKNGETTFPFLKDQEDLSTSSEIKSDNATNIKRAQYFFGGLKIEIPEEYYLHSPIFDIPVYSEKGLNLRHRSGNLEILGDIQAQKGTLYLFNNALKIDKLSVDFPKIKTTVMGEIPSINPDLRIETSFNVKGADQAVKATMTGKLEDLVKNKMTIEFTNKQGLTDTQIFNQIFGGEAVSDLSQGNITGLASKFSDVFLRGLFSPLTSRISELLGLEELSFGIVGQSVSGPIFNFKIRSNPFFWMNDAAPIFFGKDLVEERLQQLSFLNRLRIGGEGTLTSGEQAIYKLGLNYSLGENWALDYQFKSDEQRHSATVKGSYSLPAVLNWLGYWRDRFNGKLEPAPLSSSAVPTAMPSQKP
ncbi:MAG: translocation/assembly module TamB domain-containing protein [Candidatus Sericytochromatia bacterium]|nr:translocation/assembly module TamB domain-containing protein [Candidatus Sericytochromatia bacterium]